jgi:hypothetical protein
MCKHVKLVGKRRHRHKASLNELPTLKISELWHSEIRGPFLTAETSKARRIMVFCGIMVYQCSSLMITLRPSTRILASIGRPENTPGPTERPTNGINRARLHPLEAASIVSVISGVFEGGFGAWAKCLKKNFFAQSRKLYRLYAM